MFAADGGLADACGVVEVKRVASVAERGITTGVNGFDPWGGIGEELGRNRCCLGYHI
jgi:hypothetical protein